MKPIETETYKGITINIHSDDFPANPFEEFECEPPLLVLGLDDRNPTAYNKAPQRWGDILELLPPSCFERGKRMELIKKLDGTLREFAEENRNMGTIEAICTCLTMQYGATPSGWRTAQEWFEAAAWILNWGGIPAVYKQSMGHCQGDIVLCLAVATPAWVEMVGAPPETHKRQLWEAIELYGNWAWGNVYGFKLEDGDGNDIDDIGCSIWGFYGWDHEKSGLMSEARAAIESYLAEVAELTIKEEQAEKEREAAQAKEAETLTAAFTF